MRRIRRYLTRVLKWNRCTIFFMVILLMFFHGAFLSDVHFCHPAKPLWWFCPWPDPRQTVCSWKDHFKTMSSHNDSYERVKEDLSNIEKVQRSFQFNPLTLRKCEENSIDLLVFIISKYSNASTRQAIRRTWAHKETYETYFPSIQIKFLFLLDFNPHFQNEIKLEYEVHHDLVQVINLPEHYDYVTYREAAMYTFIYESCQQSKYLLKTDDDIFLNLFALFVPSMKHFDITASNDARMIMYGDPIEHGLVIRSPSALIEQRYIVTTEEYSCPRYPTFLSGFAYILSYPTVAFLLELFQRDTNPFLLSDVYFTGLLPELFHIPRISISNDFTYLYQRFCDETFFSSISSEPFACAATNQHFHSSSSFPASSVIADYNTFWAIIKERYLDTFILEN